MVRQDGRIVVILTALCFKRVVSSMVRAYTFRNIAKNASQRYFASNGSIGTPRPATATWERSAVRVKNTDGESNPYMDLIRDTHDPSMHLKTIEDELKGTIGKALGKQAEKIFYYVSLMKKEFDRHQASEENRLMAAQAYNKYRKQAIQARWELLVHRQAAGFIINNHKYVMEHYPIAEALPEEGEDIKATSNGNDGKNPKKKIGNQLDWWQRIGRWR